MDFRRDILLRISWLCSFLPAAIALWGQPELPPAFRQKLARSRLELLWPTEARYRAAYVPRTPFEHYDYALYSAREGLEMRFAIHPWSDDVPASQQPQLLAMRAAASAATNEEEWVITMRLLDEEELAPFGAEGGAVYFFKPKARFAQVPHCRLLVIYRAGCGTALVYYLFSDPDNPALDRRFHVLRFRPASGDTSHR